MAYILGEASVRVTPNAEDFHKDLRREVRKLNKTTDQVEVKVKVDEEDASRQLDRLKYRADQLDGRVINLKVDVDDSEVSRKMADLHRTAEDSPIVQRISHREQDFERIRQHFDDFQKSRAADPLHMHVLADWRHADDEMNDFREKQKARPIIQTIKIEGPTTPDMPGAANMDRQTLSMARSADKAIKRQWSIISLVPDLISKMDEQVDRGIRQIYDPYLKLVANTYNAMAKPFRGFRKIWNESRTMQEFLDNLNLSMERFRERGADTFLNIMAQVERISVDGRRAIRRWTDDIVLRLWSVRDRGVSAFKKLGDDIVLRFWAVRDAASNAFSRIFSKDTLIPIQTAFYRMGHAIRHGFELAGDGARAFGRKLVSALPDSALLRIAALQNAVYELTSGLQSMAAGWGRAIVGTITDIGNRVIRLRDGILGAISNLGERIGRVGRSVGSFLNNVIIGGIMDDLYGVADMVSVAWSRASRKYGPAISNFLLPYRAQVQGIFRDISAGFRAAREGAVNYAQGLAANFIVPLQNFATKARGIFDGVLDNAQRNFTNMGFVLRSSMSRAIGDTGAMFSLWGEAIGKRSSRMFAPIGRGLSRVMANSLNDRTTFRAMQLIMKRLSDYTMGFARVATGAFAKVGGTIVKSLLPALAAAGAGILLLGGQAAIGAIMALGGAILSVAHGALLMVPALGAAAGISFAALKIGLEDVGDAVSQAFNAETVEDFEEAIKDMPASVQAIARAFREFKPAMDEMKRAVQDNLLEGLAPGITAAMNALFPTISSGLQAIAAEWNGALKMGLDQLASPESESGMAVIMANVTEMAKEMQPVLANLIAAFGDLAEQGSHHLAPIGEWITDITQRFREWAASLREIDESTGLSRFDTIMKNAATNLGHLVGIFGGLFGVMGNVFSAGATGGQGMLGGMAKAMQDLNESTKAGTENYAAMVEFVEDANAAASQFGEVLKPAWGIVVDIASILVNLAEGAIPGIAAALVGVEEGLQPIRDISNEFGENLGEGIGALAPALESLGGLAAPLLAGIGEGLGTLLVGIGPSLNMLVEAFQPAAEAIAPLFEKAGVALTDIFVEAAPLIASGAAILETIAPILGDIFEWIGKIGAKLLEVIGPLLTEHDEQIMKLLENIRPLVDVIGENLMKLLEFLSPYIGLIADAFGLVVSALAAMIPYIIPIADFFMNVLVHGVNILMPLAGLILGVVAAFKIFGVAMQVFKLFQGIITAVRIVWTLLSLAFSASPIGFVITLIVGLVGTLIYFFTQTETGREIWDKFTTFLGDAWQWFSDKLASIWNWIVENVWTPLVNKVNEIRETWSNFTSFLGDKFSSFRDSFVRTWNDAKAKVFDTVQGIVDGFKESFRGAVDTVKNIWDGLRKIFADPISFFIETVVNRGVIGGWNSVMDLIKQDDLKLQEISMPAGLKFATGGVLPGYTPGKDVHTFFNPQVGNLHLSGGEAIMRPEWTRAVGGPKAVAQMNEDARHGRIRKPGLSEADRKRLNKQHSHHQGGVLDFGRYAQGGILAAMEAIVGQKYPMLVPMYSGYRPGGQYHGTWQAGDFSNGMDNTPAQTGLAHDIAETYPGSAELIYEAPGFDRQIKDGQFVGPGGGSYGFYAGAGNHRNHVHWAMTVPPTMPFGGGVFEGGSSGGATGVFSALYSGVQALIGKMISPLTDKITSYVEPFGHYGNMAIGFTKNLITESVRTMKEWITEALPGWMRGGGSEDAGNHAWEIGAGAEQWRAGVIAAFERQGETPTDERVNALLRQIQTESTGNPNAVQQIVDVNGTGPSAGMGLYQFIPSTWAAFRDPSLPNDRTHPDAAHNAAVRYFRDRHGWNTGPGGVGRGHGWYTGGVLPEFFDQGGIANGIGHLMKNTIQPERVLSPAQTVAFNDFVYAFMPELIEAVRRNPTDVRGHVDRLLAGFERSQMKAAEYNARRTDVLADRMEIYFDRKIKGEIKAGQWDSNYDRGWWDRNGADIQKNLGHMVENATFVIEDPYGYLEAEQRAREALDKAREAEAQEAKQKADEERRAAQQAELDAANSEEEKARIQERHEAEMESIQEREQAEKARIDELKKTGEYYYGYKVFGDDASNPNEYEASEAERRVLSYADALATPLGLDGPWGKISDKLPVFQELGAAINTAVPAWQAALAGDSAGFNHNVAVSQIAFREQRGKELEDLGPSALAGALEAVLSTTAQRDQQPFIGELNYTGLSDAEFAQRMDYWEAKKARQGGGTIRTR